MKRLSDFTPARVGLGSVSGSLPTKPLLEFRLAHARARDNVHFAFDTISLTQEFAQRGWASQVLTTAAQSRTEYLRRPDRGRRLSENSAELVSAMAPAGQPVFIVGDGLSALAVHRHAASVLERVFATLELRPAIGHPIWIVREARVAVGDHIGELLRADLCVVLLGERPGLTTPDSLGIYLTWQPRLGRTDGERNCISNIHGQGLSYESAAARLCFLIAESRRRKLSGVGLKEEAPELLGEPGS